MDLAAPFRLVRDAVLPPRCPGCGAVTQADHRFCAPCWNSLRFVTPPWCAGCNLPFDHDRGEGTRCATCIATPPRHAGIRAAVAYGDVARTLVLRLKYGGRIAFAETAARQMKRWLPEDANAIIPVPLHRRRLWSRGFNQTALIGAALARHGGVPLLHDVLVRARATPVLRGMSGHERRRAVRGAFRIGRDGRGVLAGRHVVLVDDVHTSGATTEACTRILLAAGAERVTILCWARVLNAGAAD